MIEWLWAALLILAASHHSTRVLALLLGVKWAANYAAYVLIAYTAPAWIDIALGAVGVVMVGRINARWADVMLAGFVLAPLIHAWHWIMFTSGQSNPPLYYCLTIAVFTVQVLALSWPVAGDYARALVRRLDGGDWGGLAGMAGEPRPERVRGEAARSQVRPYVRR